MKTSFGTLALILLIADPAFAADPIEDVPPGLDEIVGLKKGQPAPYDGQFFSDDTALRWANWLKQYKLRLRVDVREQQQICVVRMDYMQRILDSEKTRHKEIERAYELRITNLTLERDNPPWYKSPTFYVTVGVAGTVAAIFGGYAVVSSF